MHRPTSLFSLRFVEPAVTAGAALLVTMGIAVAEPQAGQTIAEFQHEVMADLATHGDKMGYGVVQCSLTPSFAPAGKTYLARAFSQREDTVIALIAVEQGKVSRWQEFDLPNLDGWITHNVTRCSGEILTVGKRPYAQRYRWDGEQFKKLR